MSVHSFSRTEKSDNNIGLMSKQVGNPSQTLISKPHSSRLHIYLVENVSNQVVHRRVISEKGNFIDFNVSSSRKNYLKEDSMKSKLFLLN